ncbi:beta-ketoacyl synthase N-terminal-like domain-containing protein [Streptomyces cupreus]|uniref:3-oxoacyl-ACP synthase n=1 Tax=Streptomyces cupreus TaxID=2759956 RepID=A0A7X1J4Z8_9ACTN|nr:beta-ketoacyl synthase N-terminal-like domain-containing protein [Streptomyces cupreus]MBC2903695.1 3-oxoacyl-ACP synthase [Streptomyces cupreus]
MSAPADLVVTGIGVVSPLAAMAALAAPPRAGNAAPAPAADAWFDADARLGPRGHKYLPPAARYLLAAAGDALADAGDCLAGIPEERRGAAVGTNHAVAALHARMDRTVISEGADGLSPATAPFFSVNLFGSHLSGRFALKAFNVTVTSPGVAGLEAVQMGLRAVTAGRSALLLAAATEEAREGGTHTDSGAVALVFERRQAATARPVRRHGSCRVRSAFVPPSLLREASGRAQARDRLVAHLAEPGADAPPTHLVLDDSPVAAVAAQAVGATGAAVTYEAVGSGSLRPMLRLAGLLAVARGPARLVSAIAQGHVAWAETRPEDARADGSAPC